MSNNLSFDNTQYGRHEIDFDETSKSRQITLVWVISSSVNGDGKLVNHEIPVQTPNQTPGTWAMLVIPAIGLAVLMFGEINVPSPDLHPPTEKLRLEITSISVWGSFPLLAPHLDPADMQAMQSGGKISAAPELMK